MLSSREKNLRKSIFESCVQTIRYSISELVYKNNGIDMNAVPLWDFGRSSSHEKRVNIHCLYLIFLNVLCERAQMACMQRTLIIFDKTLSAILSEVREQIMTMTSEASNADLQTTLLEVLFDECSCRYTAHSESDPLDFFMFVYLGISLKRYQHVLEGIVIFASTALSWSAPCIDHSGRGEDHLCTLMHIATEFNLVLSLFHFSLVTTLKKNNPDVLHFMVCDNAIEFLSLHKATTMLTTFALRSVHFYLALALERFDVVEILLEDVEETNQQHRPNDFHLHFKLFHKLKDSITMEDILESDHIHRAYSIHTQGMWNKIDPIISEVVQSGVSTTPIDEGYRYITFLQREECSEILKDKPIGSFLVRPQSSSDCVDNSEVHFTQFLLSFRSAPSTNNGSTSPPGGDLVKHAVIRRDRGIDGKFNYRCGKLGPTGELLQILKEISGILSSGLKFEQIAPSAIPLFDSTDTLNSVKFSKRDVLSVVDLNKHFHGSLQNYLPTLLNNLIVDPRFNRTLSVGGLDELIHDDDSDASGDTADTAPDRFEGLIAEENVEEYQLENTESGYHEICLTLLRFLCWKKFLLQSLSLLFILEIFAFNDDQLYQLLTQSTSYLDRSIHDVFQTTILPELYNSSVFFSVQTLVELEEVFGDESKEYKYELILQLISPFIKFLNLSEERLIKAMLIPPFSASVMRQNRNNCGLMWYYANSYRDRESLVVEAMLQRFLRSMSPLAVKINANTNGLSGGYADSVWVMDCVETNVLIPTMGQFLAHLDEFLSQPLTESNQDDSEYFEENKVDPFYEVDGEETETVSPGETLSEKIRQNLERRKNRQLFYRDSVVGETLKKLTSPLDTLFHFQPTDTSNRNVPVVSSNSVFTNYESHTGPVTHDKKMLQLLSIVKDILCNSDFPYYPYSTSKSLTDEALGSNNISVDMAQRVITLLYRHKSLRQFIKPADLAFLPSISYYKYVDLWEVKAISEENTGRELVTLGRHVYRTLPIEGGSGGKTPYLSIVCNLYAKSKKSSKDVDPVEQAISELKPFANLWSRVRAEEYILNTIVKTPSYSWEDVNKPMATPYIQSLNLHLYKNVMLKRMHMPYRFCGVVQVDLYGLKQVVSTRSIGKRQEDALVVASQTAHQSSIEVFAVIKLIKNYKVDDSGGVLYADSIFHSGNPDQLAQSGISARSIQEGSYLTASKRVEPHVTGSNSKKGDHDSHGSTSNSKLVLAQISQSLDYDFRSKGLFRFALPESWMGAFLNQNPDAIPTHGQEELYGQIRSSPPLKVAISIYEKTFFGDIKIGHAEMDMSHLTENTTVRDWFPLRGEGQMFSWLVYSQAKLHFQMMQLDDLPDEFPYNGQVDFDKVVSNSSISSQANNNFAKATQLAPMAESEASRKVTINSAPSIKLPEQRPVNIVQPPPVTSAPSGSSSGSSGVAASSTTSTAANLKPTNLMTNMKSVFSPVSATNVASHVASSFINAVGKPMAAVNAKVDSKAPAPAKPQKKFLSQLDEFF